MMILQEKLDVSGSFSGSFQGDGSQLTGLSADPFPYSGSADITGSLAVTGSVEFSYSSGSVGAGAWSTGGALATARIWFSRSRNTKCWFSIWRIW